jgi:UDP-N-acetylglucosamine:LPS N-acetylglucosamine transferase
MSDSRIKLLVVLGDGGHTAEIIQLVELLGPAYDYSYIKVTNDLLSDRKITIQGPVYSIKRPRAKDEAIIIGAFQLLGSFLQAARVLRKTRPHAVLGSGPAVMVPVALAAKLFRTRVIFIETASRVTSLSLTGKIMLRLADLFFVQWEQLGAAYPQTTYAGRLL